MAVGHLLRLTRPAQRHRAAPTRSRRPGVAGAGVDVGAHDARRHAVDPDPAAGHLLGDD